MGFELTNDNWEPVTSADVEILPGRLKTQIHQVSHFEASQS